MTEKEIRERIRSVVGRVVLPLTVGVGLAGCGDSVAVYSAPLPDGAQDTAADVTTDTGLGDSGTDGT